MILRKLDPDTLAPPHGWAQTVVATGSRFVFASGQVAARTDETPAAGPTDYQGQANRATANAYEAIIAGGATVADIVRLTIYVVDPTPENLEALYRGIGEAGHEYGARRTAMTLIGVTGLSDPRYKVEMEATALID
jgi:enamine deaminase RidA (YjgF/YER057c/UK114 family)